MEKKIQITKGVGQGVTDIAAFDSALFNAGIANYNLIRLSSIIPPNHQIQIGKAQIQEAEFGHKLYLVYASEIQREIGKEAWAGIGWVLVEDGSGRGLFTEHEGGSREEVESLIKETLSSMITYRSDSYGPIQSEIVGTVCEGEPVCALVAAVYSSQGWN